MVTVTPERVGDIEPETVTESPIVRLEEETEQEIVVEILDTMKDFEVLIASVYEESPSQDADTFHDPTASGV